jgi:hypothetical protein
VDTRALRVAARWSKLVSLKKNTLCSLLFAFYFYAHPIFSSLFVRYHIWYRTALLVSLKKCLRMVVLYRYTPLWPRKKFLRVWHMRSRRTYETSSPPSQRCAWHGKTLRHSHAMSGFAGLSQLKSRKPGVVGSVSPAKTSPPESVGHAVGPGVPIVEKTNTQKRTPRRPFLFPVPLLGEPELLPLSSSVAPGVR